MRIRMKAYWLLLLAHSFCCVFLSFLCLGMHENLVWQLWFPLNYLSINMLVNMFLPLVDWCLMLLGKERKARAVRPFYFLLFKCFLGSVQFGFRWDLSPPLSVVLVGYLNRNVRGSWYHWFAYWEKGPPWPLSVLRAVTLGHSDLSSTFAHLGPSFYLSMNEWLKPRLCI